MAKENAKRVAAFLEREKQRKADLEKLDSDAETTLQAMRDANPGMRVQRHDYREGVVGFTIYSPNHPIDIDDPDNLPGPVAP